MSDIEQRLRGENPEKHTVVDRLRLYAAMPETFVFDSGDAVELDELALEAAGELARLEADNASLRSKMEEAEGALEPFAKAADAYDGLPPPKYFGDTDFETHYPDSTKAPVKVGDLRTARRALQAVGPEPAAWQSRQQRPDGSWPLWAEVNEDTAVSLASQNRTDIQVRPLYSALVATPPAERVVEADAEPANCISFDTKDRLVGALRTAIDHIEHMSAFLSKLQAGYSFEGIGEDMPNLRDALASATSSDVTKYPAGVSSRDHIAHDMKIGRFPRQSSIDTFLRERALATKPAVKDDETVVEALHNAEYICDRWEKNQGINSLTIAVRSLLAALAAKDGRS